MFYRRKILLALLEECGGSLNSTDFQKLLFLFCQKIGINHYDFFPYHFGCFSFLSYQDKRVLTQSGFLTDEEGFVIKESHSWIQLLNERDRVSLHDFVAQTEYLRGDSLIKYVYLNYPYFASRSEIIDRVLNKNERAKINSFSKREFSQCLFSIGYEGLTIDAYIDKLIQNNISMVIDVRRNPISMKYGFSKTRFCSYLDRAGILYEHLPELGIQSSLRKNLKTENEFKELFELYASTTLQQSEESLRKIQLLIPKYSRVALTCFEANVASCHRHKIIEHLQAIHDWNIPIQHIA